MVKCLAAFQNQALFNYNYELFFAKDENMLIHRYSYNDCKWSKEREGKFKFSPDAVAAFQNTNNLNFEWFTVKDNRLQHWWIESNPEESYRDFFLGAVGMPKPGQRLFRTTHRVIATTKYLVSKMDTCVIGGGIGILASGMRVQGNHW